MPAAQRKPILEPTVPAQLDIEDAIAAVKALASMRDWTINRHSNGGILAYRRRPACRPAARRPSPNLDRIVYWLNGPWPAKPLPPRPKICCIKADHPEPAPDSTAGDEANNRHKARVAAFDRFSNEPRWVAWRREQRKAGGKLTKQPYNPHNGKKAKANDPQTWGTRSQAEHRAKQLINGKDSGGIGIQLGDLGEGTYLAGIDLDSCIDEHKCPAPWAEQLLTELPTYVEYSPSGTGVKVFFRVQAAHVRSFLDLIGVKPEQWGCKRSIGGGNEEHGPAVELYCSHRYFAVTERLFPGKADEITLFDWLALERLAQASAEVTAGNKSNGTGRDKTRSAAALRRASELYHTGRVRTLEEVIEALRNDPDPGIRDWVREKGEANGMRELHRIWNRIVDAGTAEDQAKEQKAAHPLIKLTGGNRPDAVAAGIEALTAAPFYRHADKIVYVLRTPAKAGDGSTILIPSIAPVQTPHLLNELGKRAIWQKYDGRRKHWVEVDVPYEIATTIAAIPNEWPFPPIYGVINTQTMRPDGTLLTAPGYDRQTHFVLFDPPPMLPILEAPSRDDALAALHLIDGLLDEFPFADTASRSVALSLIMSLVLRPALAPAVPLHTTNAPEGGTGKSYVFDIASVLAIGEITPAIARGHTPEETEKRLIGAALEGRLLIMLDNCNGELRSEFLCQAIERPMIKPRPLGTTRMPTIPNGFVVGANGNNIETADDLVRRELRCNLDANMEQPYLRSFKRKPTREILSDRGRYIAAVLTITRAYIVAGKPDRPTPLASFEAWSDLVRGPLIWLGRADPVDTMAQLAKVDPARQQRTEIFDAIGFYYKGGNFTVADVIKTSLGDDELRTALLAVARGRGEDAPEIRPERLAKWLNGNINRIAGRYKLVRVSEKGARVNSWLLQPQRAPGALPKEGATAADEIEPGDAGCAGSGGLEYTHTGNVSSSEYQDTSSSLTFSERAYCEPAKPAEPANARPHLTKEALAALRTRVFTRDDR